MQGIYAITNKITGCQYIGSSGNIRKRWKNHRKDLGKQRHHSRYLQNSWNKHGRGLFSFEVVAQPIDGTTLVELERLVIAERQPKYNSVRPEHDNGGWTHCEKTKAKLRQQAKSLWEDPSYLEKYNQAIAPHNAAMKEKWAQYRLAKKSLRRLANLKRWLEVGCLYYDGRLQSKAAWADELGISWEALRKRIVIARGNLHQVLGAYRVPGKKCLYPKPLPTPQNQTMLTYKGRSQTLNAWSEETGLAKGTIVGRLSRGWTVEEALTIPKRPPGGTPPKTYLFEGELRTLKEIAELAQVTTTTAKKAIDAGRDPRAIKRGPKPASFEVDGETKTLKEWAEELGSKEEHIRYFLRKRGGDPQAAMVDYVRDRRAFNQLTRTAL